MDQNNNYNNVDQETSQVPVTNANGINKAKDYVMNNKKKVVIIGVVAVALIVLCVLFFGKKTINLNNYVTITFSGYDTYGTASVDVDYGRLMSDITGKDINESNSLDYIGIALQFDSAISGDLSKTSGLSNGEEVVLKWTLDTELIEDKYKVKINGKDLKKKVEDLAVVQPFDAFAGVEIEYSGMAPNATASIKLNGTKLSSNYYNLSKANQLSNGDKITVSINEGNVPSICQNYGVIPSALTKEFTVEGLSGYVSKLDEIPSDAMDKMKKQAEDEMKSKVAESWEAKFNSMNYRGAYLLNDKGNSWGDKNMLYLVYEVNSTDDYGDFTYYWYCKFRNIITMPDGTVSLDYTSYSVPEASNFWGLSGAYVKHDGPNGNYFWYEGYKDLDTLFNKCVTEQINSYTYESSVK